MRQFKIHLPARKYVGQIVQSTLDLIHTTSVFENARGNSTHRIARSTGRPFPNKMRITLMCRRKTRNPRFPRCFICLPADLPRMRSTTRSKARRSTPQGGDVASGSPQKHASSRRIRLYQKENQVEPYLREITGPKTNTLCTLALTNEQDDPGHGHTK